LAFVALVCAAGCTPGQPVSSPRTPAASAPLPPVASQPPAPTESTGHDDDSDTNVPPPPPAGQPGPVVAGFAAAWVRADLPADRWWSAVAPFCDTGFAQRLRTVDPSNLPATKVTGTPVQVSSPAGGPAVFTVATDGGVLVVTVAAANGRWLVTDNDFRREVG
jgi:hypothetical protein